MTEREWLDAVRDPDDRLCADCAADEFVCARKASLGGRACCPACSHVRTTRRVESPPSPSRRSRSIFFLTARRQPQQTGDVYTPDLRVTPEPTDGSPSDGSSAWKRDQLQKWL